MIGSAKIIYTNEDVCQLVRKDLVDKFGNRELANYNLYLPGVVKPKAVVTSLPNPDVKITSVEDQIKEMGILPKPSVSRGQDSVSASTMGEGAPITYQFDVKQRKMVVAGGPVVFSDLGPDGEMGHWYIISVKFPVGYLFTEGDVISYTQNGEPKSYEIKDDDVESETLEFVADAKFTTMNISINWGKQNAVETIYTICNASLAETAIDKIPEFPTQPKFEFVYPPSVTVDSTVEVDVDLDCGKR